MSTTEIISLIAQIIGSLALFLFGMSYLSEALQRIAGSGLRKTLSSFTSNRFKAILTGTVVTVALQSSSATTVMVVSFVNAGLIQLTNAIGVIMGANIGTTFTAWIIALLGLKYGLPVIPIIGLGFIMMLLRSKKIRTWGEFFIGFGLLFLGLQFLQTTIETIDLAHNPTFVGWFEHLLPAGSQHIGFLYVLLFILIGAILTMVVQASSAMLALSMLLCTQGAIPIDVAFEVVVAMVLGQNIGTTITANLAAMVGNTSARRAARAHLLFNVIGMLWVLPIFYPSTRAIANLTEDWFGANPYTDLAIIPIGISLYHTFFNVINTFLLVWFIPQIETATNVLIKKKSDDEDIFKLTYIESGVIKVGEIAVESAKKELQVYARRIVFMYDFIPTLLNIKEAKEYNNLLKRIEHYEEISDRMEFEIANYLTQVTGDGLGNETAQRIRGMLRIVDNLESIGDQNFQLAKMIDQKNEQKIWFTPTMRENITQMFKIVRESLVIMQENMSMPYKTVDITKALDKEKEINQFRDKLRNEHLESLKNNDYTYQTGIVYSSLFALLEKIGDHAINISEAIVNTKYTKDESLTEIDVESITNDND